MPYIKPKYRKQLEESFTALYIDMLNTASAMHSITIQEARAKVCAFVIFKLLRKFFGTDIYGWYLREHAPMILDALKAEWRRRFVGNYEQKKLDQYGDVE